MALVTFQVIDGVDKGRVFLDLPTPVTIGREEGNTIRLNDERISRFHAKVQQDQEDLILTDLESTNGTRVNGQLIQIHRMRHGDLVMMGRSMLLFGSMEEIAARQASLSAVRAGAPGNDPDRPTMINTAKEPSADDQELNFNIAEQDSVKNLPDAMLIGAQEFPPLPTKLTPSQSARLAEMLDFLHRSLAQTTQNAHATDEGARVTLDFPTWQRVLQLQMLLSRYQRAITDPDSWPTPQ
jgi:hypothetical protein